MILQHCELDRAALVGRCSRSDVMRSNWCMLGFTGRDYRSKRSKTVHHVFYCGAYHFLYWDGRCGRKCDSPEWETQYVAVNWVVGRYSGIYGSFGEWLSSSCWA